MVNGTNLIFHHFYGDSRLCSRGSSRLADSYQTGTPLVASPRSDVPCPGRGQPLRKSSPNTKARAV